MIIIAEPVDMFNLKQIRLDPTNPALKGLLSIAYRADKNDFLEKLLIKGFDPGEYDNKKPS